MSRCPVVFDHHGFFIRTDDLSVYNRAVGQLESLGERNEGKREQEDRNRNKSFHFLTPSISGYGPCDPGAVFFVKHTCQEGEIRK